MSMTWWNCERMPPLSLTLHGQETATPWRMPPKKDGICLVHLWDVSNAQAHGTVRYVVGAPHVVPGHLFFRGQVHAVEHQSLVRSAKACPLTRRRCYH
jgi:hypothetical protein